MMKEIDKSKYQGNRTLEHRNGANERNNLIHINGKCDYSLIYRRF